MITVYDVIGSVDDDIKTTNFRNLSIVFVEELFDDAKDNAGRSRAKPRTIETNNNI